uniref:Venom toxin n=1 Tax=Hemiscorpius lepturus TaxID=520031 RepID=A0A1L4BJ78_HEMLE|nr:venom toxin [Hemiscorpius lepturus]
MKLLYTTSWYLLPMVLPFLRLSDSTTRFGTYDTISREANLDDAWHASRSDLENSRNSDSCPELYQRFSKEHTYCRKSTCNVLDKGVSKEEKEIILGIHNNFRSKLATGRETTCHQLPSAANMMEMEWDEELARIAQAHANLCVFNHDESNDRAVENFPVGQNMVYTTSSKKNWRAIESWYKEEVCFYTPDIVPSFRSGEYNHFSQVTWANTWKVGCGYAEYNDGGKKKGLYTCNYGPEGNFRERPHYVAGEPCSQCPKNTECSTSYAGLCKSKTEDGPQMNRPSSNDYILYCDFSDDDPSECSSVGVKGSRNFSTRHIYGGNYKTVVLNGGESVEIDVGWAQDKKGICPFLYLRFGPNNAKDTKSSSLTLAFYTSPGAPVLTTALNVPESMKNSFTIRGMHMKFGGKLKSVFTYKANEGAAPQYIDIKAFGITRGPCQTSF